MAILISNGATSLSTASGFYRVESSNLGMFSTTDLALTSTRTISVTFANAGNCQGLVLALTNSSTTPDKSVTVTLQENVASVFTDRATVTLSAATLTNSVANASADGWIVPFTGGTFPYAVTTAASTWRFQITQGAGSSGDWSIRTSNATAPFYATWCDNALTFANNDTVICKDVVTVDQTATCKGVTSTGDTLNAPAIIVCRSTTPTTASVANLVWQNPPSASYTLTIDGLIVLGAHSGMRIGTSASRISNANQAIVSFINPTAGLRTGIVGPELITASNDRKASITVYGEIPSVPDTTLVSDAAVGSSSIQTSVSTSWANGNRIFIGKQDATGVGDTTLYTLSGAASGIIVSLTSTVATNARKSGGSVINIDRYGVKIVGNTTSRPFFFIRGPSNFQISGALIEETSGFTLNNSNTLSLDDSANTAQYDFSDCALYTTSGTTQVGIATVAVPVKGLNIDGVNGARSVPVSTITYVNGSSGTTTYQNTISLSTVSSTVITTRTTYQTNRLENFSGQVFLAGVQPTFKNNTYWAGSSSSGSVLCNSVVKPIESSGNTYNRCTLAFIFGSNLAIGGLSSDDQFGNEVANTTDVAFTAGAYLDWEFASPFGNLTIDTTEQANLAPGSQLRVSDLNNTANDDRNWLMEGFIVRTGSGLSDSTVWITQAFGSAGAGDGVFGMRFQPNSGSNLLKWQQNFPTGDIQNKTMQVSCRVKINNAAFYAGTHTKPTLRVKYDNATEITAVATGTTSDQQLQVTFTPATAYGQITITFELATDAAGSNAYVYLGTMVPNLPDGVAIDTTDLSKWANAMPVTPSIATIRNPASTWDELLAYHSVSGSFGAFVKQLLKVGQFLALK